MAGRGFIVLDRRLLEWKWRDNMTALGLWVYILLKANWKDGHFMGELIPRGSFATSTKALSEETDLSESTVKRWLKKFESAQQISTKATNRYTVITVINYAKYQDYDVTVTEQMNHQVTEQVNHQVNHQVTEQVNHNRTNKQYKQRNKETKEQYITGETPEDFSETDSVIDYLNLVTGQKYKHSKTSRKHIHARLAEGFTVNECKMVIDKKTREWIGTDMMKYLNPDTLFAGKFEKYLNQIETPRKRDIDDILMEEHFKNEQRGNSKNSENDQFGLPKINWD